MHYRVRCKAMVTDLEGNLGEPDDLERFLDAVLNALLELEGTEHDVGAALAKGESTISVLVEADSELDALLSGGSVIRTAVHAAGGTPDWTLYKLLLAIESTDAELIGA